MSMSVHRRCRDDGSGANYDNAGKKAMVWVVTGKAPCHSLFCCFLLIFTEFGYNFHTTSFGSTRGTEKV